MKIYLYLLLFILCYYIKECTSAQPYFPSQILFFAGNTLYAIDEINQRAYKSDSSSIKQSETAYALKNFPFAIPGSPQSKYYVQLLEGFPNIGCIYGTYWEYGGSTFNAFPSHWSNGTSFEIKNFMGFKYEMILSNTSSVYEDYWYSNVTCQPQSPKRVPCEEIYFRKNTDIPVRSTQVISTPWEVRQFTTNYLVISVGKPDDKYFDTIPKDWARTCRDVMLGVSYNPQSTKVDLNESAKVQVWLPTPPHRIDRNDTVHILWKADECTNCFTLSPKELIFNIENFHERQTLTITRVKNGPQTHLIPIINGGGFDDVPVKNYTIFVE
ncbi:unnamed protein product [Didymodactylos carnosus]|uniref:Uncharacterized protein n=1 Tax=Didymodactylos carnosus TaxID=1234261 RepID=A0A815NDT4_9BILA|nr:unnamed protein product [Didymodactylos carnosus]CAF4313590.1 unnamed protein product [Didymodactylos carnosus]